MTTGFIQPKSMDIFFWRDQGSNKRIRRLCGPPAWRMMRVGGGLPLAPPKEHQSQHCCGSVGPFELSGQGSGRGHEWHTGWSHHLANHVGMLASASSPSNTPLKHQASSLNSDKTYREEEEERSEVRGVHVDRKERVVGYFFKVREWEITKERKKGRKTEKGQKGRNKSFANFLFPLLRFLLS